MSWRHRLAPSVVVSGGVDVEWPPSPSSQAGLHHHPFCSSCLAPWTGEPELLDGLSGIAVRGVRLVVIRPIGL